MNEEIEIYTPDLFQVLAAIFCLTMMLLIVLSCSAWFLWFLATKWFQI